MQGIFIIRPQRQGLLIGRYRTLVLTSLEAGITEVIQGVRLNLLTLNTGKGLTRLGIAARAVKGNSTPVRIIELFGRGLVVTCFIFLHGILLRGPEPGCIDSYGHTQRYQHATQDTDPNQAGISNAGSVLFNTRHQSVGLTLERLRRNSGKSSNSANPASQ